MTPTAAPELPRYPVWGYEDLALFISAILPSLVLSSLLVRTLKGSVAQLFQTEAATALAFQAFMYACQLGVLFLLISWKHRAPFWRSLAWTLRFPRAMVVVALGPILAISISVLGVALRAPAVDNPIERMITGRSSLAIVTLFGVLAAPFIEELLFRGFLFPLLGRTFGPWRDVIATAIPFAVLHGAQNQWAWQQILLIAIAGWMFGAVRLRTGSTAAAFLLHASYNATQFLGLILMRF